MNILFIGQKCIPALRGGGVETYVSSLARRLAAAGHKVTVYCRKKYTSSAKERWHGVERRFLPTIYRKNLEAGAHSFLCTLDLVFRQADVVFYQGIGPALFVPLARILKPSTKILFVFHCRDYEHAKWAGPAKAALNLGEWCGVRFADETIVLSRQMKSYVQNRWRKKAVFIPQAIEAPKAPLSSDVLKRWRLPPKKYILSVARFVAHKEIHTLIAGYQDLPEEIKQRHPLVIVGSADDSYAQEYQRHLRSISGNEENIRFLGSVFGRKLQALYKNALVFVQPSRSEGAPTVLLEAASFGLPIIASDIPEHKQFSPRKLSFFAVGSSGHLRAALLKVLRRPAGPADSVSYDVDYWRNVFAGYQKLLLKEPLRHY